MNEIQTPVLIIGGGGAGLTASMGSDWPFAPAPVVSYFTSGLDGYRALDAAGHAAIDQDNARALFKE